MNKPQKKRKLNLTLRQLNTSDDPTIVNCTFIILDFEKSGNNVIVDKDVALEGGSTLINKPIVALYNPPSEPNTSTDNFSDHAQYLGEDRYGNITIKSDTVPIGVFTTEGYELTIENDGEEIEVMAADAVLWRSRFPDAVDLIEEWYNSDVEVVTSCEYLYANYSFQNGIEYHHSPIYFEGHAILASEDRGEQRALSPAYDTSKLLSINEISKFNRLVAQAFNHSNKEEIDSMKYFKKVCELSHNDIRSLLYGQLDPTLSQNEYSWISDVYESYFVVNLYSYEEGSEYDKYYKFNYTNTNDVVSIDFESKSEVTLKRDWIEVTEFEQLQNSLSQKETEKKELELQLNESKTSLQTTLNEKKNIENKYSEASTKIIQLNSHINELSPYKNQVENEQYQSALNEKKSFYETKFTALNALEKFNEDETQSLIEKAVADSDEGKQAILQLNTILVDLVVVNKESQSQRPVIRETASKRENLIPTGDDFDSRYGL
ncbi:hypothetical protein V1503_18905 [Bacillus sp. SCS-151]|uniref:hypothetical protein n=1 Tax=Nanhaiella sioensis TaxID=3115293 RepID=UPI00397B1A7C